VSGLQERIAALPEWAECEGYEDGLRVDRDTLRLRAALARLALAREWIADSRHLESCEYDAWEIKTPCTCGRDALLAALEVPR